MGGSASFFEERFFVESDGYAIATAPMALLKGCLESDIPVSVIAGVAGTWFDAIAAAAGRERVSGILRSHELRAAAGPDFARAAAMSAQAARHGRTAILCVAADDIGRAAAVIEAAVDEAGASMIFVVEDTGRSGIAPTALARRLGLPTIVPGDVSGLRASIEHAQQLARADQQPVMIIVHEQILSEFDTLACQPNRVVQTVEVEALIRRRRRRRFRTVVGEGALRTARRLELNVMHNLPSPGETDQLGFVLIGPATPALRHVLIELGLIGRVPFLVLHMIQPLDTALLERLLTRCRHVIVLEATPGDIEGSILGASRDLVRAGREIGQVWTRRIPGADGAEPLQLARGDAASPSILARRLIHLFHPIRPGLHVASRLATQMPSGGTARGGGGAAHRALAPSPRERMLAVLRDVGVWLETRQHTEGQPQAQRRLIVNGTEAGESEAEPVFAELWSADAFLHDGFAAVQHVSGERADRLIVVICPPGRPCEPLRRLAEAAIPAERSSRVSVLTGDTADHIALRQTLRDAAARRGLTIVVVEDGDADDIELNATIDAEGFSRHEQLIQHADDPCNIRPGGGLDVPALARVARRSSEGAVFSVDRLPPRLRGQLRVRLRPLYEIVSVVRSRPPADALMANRGMRVAPPALQHADRPAWRARMAQVRRSPLGPAAMVLCEAGREQGYCVRGVHSSPRADHAIDAEPAAPWTDVLFARFPEDGGPVRFHPKIPFGEADLILSGGLEGLGEALLDPQRPIADAQRTVCIANVSDPADENRGETAAAEALHDRLIAAVQEPLRDLREFGAAAEALFGTARPVDLMLLGVAYQKGLVPLRLEALEAAIRRVEERGYRRLRETFEIGRLLVVDPDFARKMQRGDAQDAAHVIRRHTLLLRADGGRMRRASSDFRRLAEEALAAMPGLSETESGRAALRDFILALSRCVRWGGLGYAREYRDAIVELYRHDRGDRARSLVRHAVLPLADAMLIRDSAYVADMSMSHEARRRTRRTLNARAARGDAVTRRFLNRFELIGFGHRVRIDFRSSDWTAIAAARLMRLRPNRLRGSGAERARRGYILELVNRAARGAAAEYERFDTIFRELHDLALRGQLRHFSERALRLILESPPASPQREAISHFPPQPALEGDSDETGVPIARG